MMHVDCQICEKDNSKIIKKEDIWNIVQCKNCGFAYMNPQPDENYLKQHYQNYLPTDQSEIEDWKYMMSGVFRKSLDIIDKSTYNTNPKKLLDIGCGYGFFLQMATERNWTASGIDLSEKATSYAKSKGLDASNTNLFEKNYRDEEFNVITMFYVLEHLPNPTKYLQEVYRILKPHGLLLIRVPHTTPIAKMLKTFNIPNKLYDAPSHLSDFSPRTIKQLLKKVKFKDMRTTIGGMTYPASLAEKHTSCFFGTLATFLDKVTFGRCLLPGVSKTTIARKKSNA